MLHQELSAPGREGREQELTAGPSVSAGKLLIHHPSSSGTTTAAQPGLHSHRVHQLRCQNQPPTAWIFLTTELTSEGEGQRLTPDRKPSAH